MIYETGNPDGFFDNNSGPKIGLLFFYPYMYVFRCYRVAAGNKMAVSVLYDFGLQ